jgi:hypothetical protein
MSPTTPVVVAQAITPLFRHEFKCRVHRGCHQRHRDRRAQFERNFRDFLKRLTDRMNP